MSLLGAGGIMKPHAFVLVYIVESDSKPARAGGRGSDG